MMRPSPYETAVLAFLADGKPRTHREISDACGCRNASRVVGKMQRAIRLRREAVKLIKSTRGTGRNLVVTWQIIGPSKERQRLIDKGIEAGILFCTKTKIHGQEGNRNAAIFDAENISDERFSISVENKALVETIAILENRSVASCVREALGQWIEGRAREHHLGNHRNAK
jgi:hypothetical protein